ncbi:MAG TPA: hypothetical protein VMT93_11195 [Gemmatimonadaceae bacterium]|nr:hypothetical protein [Gemmatimonadaceae bacterium]
MVSPRLRARPGKVRLGCILSLLLVGAIVYFGYNVASVALDYYQYQDAMDQEARFAMRLPNDVIATHLRAKADSLDLPESAKKVQIRRKGNEIFIWADYTVNIELPGFVQEVELRPHVERVF